MNYHGLIKEKLQALNHSEQRLADLFIIMHESDGIFAEQVRDRFFVQKISYREIKRHALNMARYLSQKYQGQHLGVALPNSYLYPIIYWGIILSGNTPVLLNPDFDEETRAIICRDLDIQEIFDQEAVKKIHKELFTKVEPLRFNYDNAANQFVLTTTGATGKVKYCYYNGKSISNFLNKTPFMAKKVPGIIGSKKIKHLALLPFYHCFGLFAVYYWFGFFGLPFLFVESLTDLMVNIRRHHVTHIFAVPLFFKAIAREIRKKAKAEGKLAQLEAGLEKSFAIQKKYPFLRGIVQKKFKEVTSNSLGNRICFMISGGASIDQETLKLFNCLGYNLHPGYGMSELGITSLTLKSDIEARCRVSIGEPLPHVKYELDEQGILQIISDTAAFKVINGNEVIYLDDSTPYNTKDKCLKDALCYCFEARDDEIIAAENGENYNLNALQASNYNFDLIDNYCFIPYQNDIAFLVSVAGIASDNVAQVINEIRNNELLKMKKVSSLLITEQPLRTGLKMINYRQVVAQMKAGQIKVVELATYAPRQLASTGDMMVDKIKQIISKDLNLHEDFGDEVDLFLELGCSSFDYYVILQDLANAFNIDLSKLKLNEKGFLDTNQIPRTVTEIKRFIEEYQQ